jgi:hypothetical protein
MSDAPTDLLADLLLLSWDDLDRWLLTEANTLTRQRLQPSTTAYVMHGGTLTLWIQTPPLCEADAEQIGRALGNMVHPTQPDQVVLTFPAVALDRSGSPTTMLHAMAGERRGDWRHVQVPLPYDDPQTPIELSDGTTADEWTRHVRAVFDDAPPPAPDLSKVRHLEAEFTVAVNPNGPAGTLAHT